MIPTWMLLGLVSALFLGLYETAKKKAVHDNAVLPTLLLSVTAGATCMLPVLLVNLLAPAWAKQLGVATHALSLTQHAAIMLKAGIVGTSWVCAYLGLKHLPLSIASPVRASAPIWTLLGAVLILNEMPAAFQWLGLLFTIVGYVGLSFIGQKEGIIFRRNPWILLVLAATLLGTMSALYDKVLLHEVRIEPVTLQLWFSLYLVPFTAAITACFWYPKRHSSSGQGHAFSWRWSAAFSGALLILADASYFIGLADADASIALMSAIRRSSR